MWFIADSQNEPFCVFPVGDSRGQFNVTYNFVGWRPWEVTGKHYCLRFPMACRTQYEDTYWVVDDEPIYVSATKEPWWQFDSVLKEIDIQPSLMEFQLAVDDWMGAITYRIGLEFGEPTSGLACTIRKWEFTTYDIKCHEGSVQSCSYKFKAAWAISAGQSIYAFRFTVSLVHEPQGETLQVDFMLPRGCSSLGDDLMKALIVSLGQPKKGSQVGAPWGNPKREVRLALRVLSVLRERTSF